MDHPRGKNLIAGRHHDGNPSTGLRGSTLEAEFFNLVGDELVGLVEAAGLEPDYTDRTQIARAVDRLAGRRFATLDEALAQAAPDDGPVRVDGAAAPGDGGGFLGLPQPQRDPYNPGGGQLMPLADWLTPRMFGARGDGTGDDSAAINHAMRAAAERGRTLYFQPGIYRITAPLRSDRTVTIVGDGPNSIIDAAALPPRQTIMTLSGEETALRTRLSAAVTPLAAGSREVPVPDTAGFGVGDTILLRSTESFSYVDPDYRKGELGFIAGVSASAGPGVLTLTAGIKDDYLSGEVTVQQVRSLDGPSVRGLTFRANGAAGRHHGLTIFYARNALVEDVRFRDVEDTGVALQYCDSGTIARCDARNMPGTVSGTGYAFAVDLFSQNCRVTGCTGENIACGFSTGGYFPSWNTVVDGNRFSAAASQRPMIQTHSNGAQTLVIGNTVSDAHLGIGMFAPWCSAVGNIVTDCRFAGIYFITEAAASGQIIGNKIRRASTGIVAAANRKSRRAHQVVIKGNIITEGAGQHGMSIDADHTLVVDNIISGAAPGILSQGSDCEIRGNRIVDVTGGRRPFAIHLAGRARNVAILDNRVTSTSGTRGVYGLVIGPEVRDTVVRGNRFEGLAQDIRALEDTPANRTVFRDNRVNGSTQETRLLSAPAIAPGYAPGIFGTTRMARYVIDGRVLTMGPRSGLWDLSGLGAGAALPFKVVLCLTVSGGGVMVSGVPAESQTTAMLPEWLPWRACPVGVVEVSPGVYGRGAPAFTVYDIY